MKNLTLSNHSYQTLLAQFKRYLQHINYSQTTIYNAENYVKEYLVYLSERKLDFTVIGDLKNYFDYLSKRINHKFDGALSMASLHKHRAMLKLFYDFLERTKELQQPVFPTLPKPKSQPQILTVAEIKELFNSCDNTLLGKRNKTVLALYYGLGLRRKEGVDLKITEVDFGKEEILVASSKTAKQRIVPMSDHVKDILEDYIFNVREKLVPKNKNAGAVLVTEQGKNVSVNTVAYILNKQLKQTKIKKKVSLHTLRHSIATHFLEAGMTLENIALFLGHKSLDSTQIYTHIVESENEKNAEL